MIQVMIRLTMKQQQIQDWALLVFSDSGQKSASKNIETKPVDIFSKTDDAALEVFTKDPETEAVMETLPPIFPKGFLNSINPKFKEWKPSRPKWFDKEDPGYFHCHQNQTKHFATGAP